MAISTTFTGRAVSMSWGVVPEIMTLPFSDKLSETQTMDFPNYTGLPEPRDGTTH